MSVLEQVAQGPAGAILKDCISTLQQVASYRLPRAVDRRLLWLSENKEALSTDERDELTALTEFAEDRTLEKVKANATLKRLGEIFPQLMRGQP